MRIITELQMNYMLPSLRVLSLISCEEQGVCSACNICYAKMWQRWVFTRGMFYLNLFHSAVVLWVTLSIFSQGLHVRHPTVDETSYRCKILHLSASMHLTTYRFIIHILYILTWSRSLKLSCIPHLHALKGIWLSPIHWCTPKLSFLAVRSWVLK